MTVLTTGAVLFCEALHRDKPLPCISAEEFVGTPTIGWTREH
jgi:hypothetical protein